MMALKSSSIDDHKTGNNKGSVLRVTEALVAAMAMLVKTTRK
jgi:hypothetical protein